MQGDLMDESWFVGAVFFLLIALLIHGRVKPPLLFSGAIALFYLLGFISLENWLKNYVNSSLVILVLLLLISVVIEKTVFVKEFGKRVFDKNYRLSLLRLTLFTGFLSSFLNNTAVVASLISSVKSNRFHPPSKLLIPLSYAAIFGGTLTLVGTSTNLVVNGFVIEQGLPSLGMFDFFFVGIFIVVFCIVGLILFSYLLPSIEYVDDKLEEYLIETKILYTSTLIGKSVKESGLRSLEYLFLVEIQRGSSLIAPVSPTEVIRAGDVLVFSGDVKHIDILRGFHGLVSLEATPPSGNIIEVVVAPESNLIDKKVKNADFRSKFNAAIIAIKRGSKNIKKIGDAELKAGDKLMLTVGDDFAKRENIAQNFYLISENIGNKMLDKKESYFVLFTFVGALLFSAFFGFSLIKVLLFLLFTYIVSGFLQTAEIKRRFPYEIVMIVGASLGLAKVLMDSGVAHTGAMIISSSFGTYGVYGSFVGIYLLTLLLSEVVTNNAAAALTFPLGYALALSLGVNPLPFIFAVAYGASASFLSPYGYQTNLMVASVGGYKITDFVKIGFFISLIYSLVVIIAVPVFFSF